MAGQELVGRRLEHFFAVLVWQMQAIEFSLHHVARCRRIGPIGVVFLERFGELPLDGSLSGSPGGALPGGALPCFGLSREDLLRLSNRRFRRLLLLLLGELLDEGLQLVGNSLLFTLREAVGFALGETLLH